MSGQFSYSTASQPPNNMATYNGSGPSGSGQIYGQPPSAGKSWPQPGQNGPPFQGSTRSQFPPHGGSVMPHVPSGAHPAGFLPPPVGPHPHNPSADAPPTTQFNSMTMSGQNKIDVRAGQPPRPLQPIMPSSSAQINGSSQLRGASPSAAFGVAASSNSMRPPSNVARSYSGSPSTNIVSGAYSGPPSSVAGASTGPPSTNIVSGAYSGPSSTNIVSGAFSGPPPANIVSGAYSGPPSNVAGAYSGPPSNVAGAYSGPPSNVSGAYSGPPSNVAGAYSGPPSNVAGAYSGPPSNVAGAYSGPPSNVAGAYSGPPSNVAGAYSGPPSNVSAAHSGPPSNISGAYSGPPSNVSGAYSGPPSNVSGAYSGPPPANVVAGVHTSQPQTNMGYPPSNVGHALSTLPGDITSLSRPLPSTIGGLVRPPQPSFIGQPQQSSFTGGPPQPSVGKPLQPSSYGGPPQPYSFGGSTLPSNIGHHQHPPAASAGQHQSGFHEQIPPQPQQHQQFVPPPSSMYGMPPHPGQSVQNEGSFQLPPGQGQIPPSSGTVGQFPGSAPYGQQPQPAQQQKKLDPDQMPSPIQVIEDDKKNRSGVYQTNTKGSVPPLVTTKFTTQDQGNASPRFIRSTMYNIPCTADMLKSSHIPFALALTPFAEIGAKEALLPVIDMGELGPVRCKRCKAYMSPVMQFIDAGRRFQCSFCSAVTDVPEEYFAHLDHTGRRSDCFSRAELCLGSYEFVVTKDYCKNGVPPKEPAFIFMIEVSYNSVKSGVVQLICEKLKSEILVHLPREAGCDESEIRVGFITYNKDLHFYNLKNCLAQPQMMVVSDLEDMFVPLIDGFLVKLSESESLIDSLLAEIPRLFAGSAETELVLGPVIQAGLDALKSADRAGRLYIFHSGLPTVEAPGKLKNRDDRKLLGTDKEKSILTPQTTFYSKLGVDCVAAGCSVDLFLFPNQYIDVVTISDICKVTAGNIFKYSYFQADIDGERFLEDLRTSVERSQAFDAILRVRTSTGVRPVDFYGNFYMANTTDVEMASIDSDSSLCVEVKHDDKLSETEGACIQVAVLYTNVVGQRRLRCHNLALNCCNLMVDLFRNCELDVLINFFAKQALRSSLTTNPNHVREHITNEVSQILACYRKNCANPSSPGQLVLPECMKLLPLYANCVIKNDGISGGSEISTDDRGYLMHLLNRMDVKASNVFFYPRLLPIHNLDLESCEFPVAIRCSVEKLEDSGVYMLENGLSMFLWIGQNASPDLVQKIFGVSSVTLVDVDKVQLLQLSNPVSRRLCDLIAKIRKERSRYLKLTIVRQQDKLQPWFEHFLVEDKGRNSGSSYVDFLLHIHKEIRNIIS